MLSYLNGSDQKNKHWFHQVLEWTSVQCVQVFMMVSVAFLHQHGSNSCKIQPESIVESHCCADCQVLSFASHMAGELMGVVFPTNQLFPPQHT
jgi:hypothetical protein